MARRDEALWGLQVSFFLAVDLDDTARAEVVACIEAHRHAVAASWLRADKLHLTLRFLGHPTPDALAALEPVVRSIAQRTAPFTLSLRGAGFFVTARAPSVLWLGVDGDLASLHSLHAALTPLDDTRPFVPHVTLARAQSPGALETLEPHLHDFASSPFRIGGLTLYESTHTVYRAVFRLGLGHAP